MNSLVERNTLSLLEIKLHNSSTLVPGLDEVKGHH